MSLPGSTLTIILMAPTLQMVTRMEIHTVIHTATHMIIRTVIHTGTTMIMGLR